ncbi:hypothetical protein LY28_01345 [Ruminiclostridium sufflavum DSM 19573]|uniref:Head-tail joining protein n=1 Tax=Ruminiclostridium sufflavum DSM 19573 TaxID=1121337 RepID=A0A318XNT6_9FIRM|nr:hypothetical protein [Ruminiclostridium sufflavum]PYG88496.1 hypothetical protein LY28_01345 [Ruminiclostridium sufflavum DSM 19573]
MIIKTDNIDFTSFSDGVCDIYTEDEEGNKTYKYQSLGFSDRALGFNRVFAARAVQDEVNAVIRIQQVPDIDTHDTLEIRGRGKHDIILIQNKYDTNPLSIDLTLKQLEMHGG